MKLAKNAVLLTKRKLKNYILKKAKKGKPLKESEKRFNELVGKNASKLNVLLEELKVGSTEEK